MEESGRSSSRRGGLGKERDSARSLRSNGSSRTSASSRKTKQTKRDSRIESDKIFERIDTDHSKSASKGEIYKFVSKNDKLWSSLNEKWNFPERECRKIATRVAMELASGMTAAAGAMEAEITKDQFHIFRKKYILDKAGLEEFFHRSIFAMFDKDNSGELDEEEFGQFMEALYTSSKSSRRLPPREKMQQFIMKRNDIDGNKLLSYNEIQNIIRGGIATLSVLAEMVNEYDEEEESEDDDDEESSSGSSDNMEEGDENYHEDKKEEEKGAKVKLESEAKARAEEKPKPKHPKPKATETTRAKAEVKNDNKNNNKKRGAIISNNMSADMSETISILEKMGYNTNDNSTMMISKNEIKKFVMTNSKLWSRLTVQLEQPGEVAVDIATRVVMELATTTANGQTAAAKAALDNNNAKLTKEQFHTFRKRYILDEKGAEEFFHRGVFSYFDKDGSGELDEGELQQFIDVIYHSRKAYNLPPKDQVKKFVKQQREKNNTKTLVFRDIEDILTGRMSQTVGRSSLASSTKSSLPSRVSLGLGNDDADMMEGDGGDDDDADDDKVGEMDSSSMARQRVRKANEIRRESQRQSAMQLLALLETPEEAAAKKAKEAEESSESEEEEGNYSGGELDDNDEDAANFADDVDISQQEQEEMVTDPKKEVEKEERGGEKAADEPTEGDGGRRTFSQASMRRSAGLGLEELGLGKDFMRRSSHGREGSKSSADRKESDKIFRKIDHDNSKGASKGEIYKFVSSNDTLWSMLSETLNFPERECRKIATRVAMELASGLKGQEAMEAEINKDQFHSFRKRYMLDSRGTQSFFYRAVFAAFDRDGNGELDSEELDNFLDIFYHSDSFKAFVGAVEDLPPKDYFKKAIMEKFDGDGNGTLDYEEIRSIITGKAVAATAEMANKAARADNNNVDGRPGQDLEQKRKMKEIELQTIMDDDYSEASISLRMKKVDADLKLASDTARLATEHRLAFERMILRNSWFGRWFQTSCFGRWLGRQTPCFARWFRRQASQPQSPSLNMPYTFEYDAAKQIAKLWK